LIEAELEAAKAKQSELEAAVGEQMAAFQEKAEAADAEHVEALSVMEAELEATKSELEAAALAAGSKVAELEAGAAQHGEVVTGLQAQMAALKESSSGDETVLAEARGRVSELEGEVSALGADLAASQQQTKAAEGQHGEAMSAVQAWLAKAKESQSQLESQMSGVNAELDASRAAVSEATERERVLEAANIEGQSLLQTAINELQRRTSPEMSELEERLCNAETENCALEQQVCWLSVWCLTLDYIDTWFRRPFFRVQCLMYLTVV